MSITLNSPVTQTRTPQSIAGQSPAGRVERPAHDRGPRALRPQHTGRPAFRAPGVAGQSAGSSALAAAAESDQVTLTLTVTLPAGTPDVEAAQIADALRANARRLTAGRRASASVGVRSPRPFSPTGEAEAASTAPTLRALPPRTQDGEAAQPERTRRTGVVSPNSPARRDAEAARQRLLRATAVSPNVAPSASTDCSLVIDLFGRRVRIDGEDVDLTYKEFELLAHLARGARRIIGRDELMESVWADASSETGERTVDVHVRRVRAKLGRYRRLISTVRGAGYRLDTGSDVAILD
ncbi:winged helix-turn-helix domain-containing protein [Brachybacterium halotolerans subsp. kimchii]|uniref:winged helix-turn-helix domain-containing protein n=1 Tax=Brachybacterium halotolerans TaxID=2795215 RepID=UPI001E283D4B|nr:winged helix-turn-helix domain-containing protein [Brachybacterium halotolerans]UEJ81072.1 winged helix-turn-helix domain-containing protein [Brachybacterium halotolerans subsp. kimchii]